MYSILTKWWSVKNHFALTLLFLSCHNINAQVVQSQRFEFQLPSSDDRFDIVPADDEGMFLYRDVYISRTTQLQLIKLDTAFKEQWNGLLPYEKNYLLMGKRAYKGKLYLLYRFYNYTRNDLTLYIVDQNGKYSGYPIRGYIPFVPSEFRVTDEAVLIGGYYNKVPLVLHYSLKTYKSKVLPGIFNEAGELNQVRTYDDGSFDVLISAFNHKRQRTIWIKTYDPDGTLIANFPLDTKENKHLIFGRSIKTADDVQLVAGVYGSRSAEYSHGIFIASIDQAGLQQIRYYQFADLENFFKYMKAKKEARVKNRIQRRKIKGKKVRMNYRFLVHELVPYKDQFILLGEAFYPKYRSIDRSPYSSFFVPMTAGGSMIQNGKIFEGYFYTHAVVMGFKPNGDLIWDNSFEINDVRTFTLEQFVKLKLQDDNMALMYLYDNVIRTKIIQDSEVLEGKSFDPINTGKPGEQVVREFTDLNRLEYWYNDYFFAYGVQEIESNQKTRNQSGRKVFYINKIKRTN